MNILYHHRTQGHGAEGVHIMGIVKGLEKLGHRVILRSPPGVDPRQTAGAYLYSARKSLITRFWKSASKHFPQILFEGMELAYNLVQRGHLKKALAEEDIAFVYERYAFFLWVTSALAKRRGIPFILEVNEISNIPRARPLVLGRLACWVERRVFLRASHIVTVSSFLKQRIAEMGVPADRITVMPNGVDEQIFSPQADGASVRQKLGLDGGVVIGFVGWIDPWDNLPGLLEAFGDLAKRRADLKLLLVGDVAGKGVEPDYVAKLVAKLGLQERVVNVKRAPRLEMPQHIAAMDVCVIPDSNVFGSPIVLFEFMGVGRAVVAPSVLPVTDVLVTGENGMVFKAHDKADMREKLWQVAQDAALRERVSKKARECVEREHNWNRNAEKVLEIYKNLAAKGVKS